MSAEKFPTRESRIDAVRWVDEIRRRGRTAAHAFRKVGCTKSQYYRWRRGESLGTTAKEGGQS